MDMFWAHRAVIAEAGDDEGESGDTAQLRARAASICWVGGGAFWCVR